MSWYSLPTELHFMILRHVCSFIIEPFKPRLSGDFAEPNLLNPTVTDKNISQKGNNILRVSTTVTLYAVCHAIFHPAFLFLSIPEQWANFFQPALSEHIAIYSLLENGSEEFTFKALQMYLEENRNPGDLSGLLALAIKRDFIHCMKLLLESGADLATCDMILENGVLTTAVRNRSAKATSLLLSYGAFEAELQNSWWHGAENYHEPLATAITQNSLDVAETLLKAGSNPDQEILWLDGSEGYRPDPLHYFALESKDATMLELLIRYGLKIPEDPEYVSSENINHEQFVSNPLELAFFEDALAVVKVLLRNGMRLKDMHRAIQEVEWEDMRALLQSYV